MLKSEAYPARFFQYNGVEFKFYIEYSLLKDALEYTFYPMFGGMPVMRFDWEITVETLVDNIQFTESENVRTRDLSDFEKQVLWNAFLQDILEFAQFCYMANERNPGRTYPVIPEERAVVAHEKLYGFKPELDKYYVEHPEVYERHLAWAELANARLFEKD